MAIIVTLSLTRKKSHLTQEELADLAKRSQQLIGKLEQQKAQGIGFKTLNQLCIAVGATSIDEVVAFIPDDPSQLDDALAGLSKQLDCSIDDILFFVPEDLKAAYREHYRHARV
ncbi:MAG: hypothetical protein J7647_27590 [Cyanobacteria bacterium SBLK]|nr:hypothetical protein [Cyanobacteria bacterium SBLK]